MAILPPLVRALVKGTVPTLVPTLDIARVYLHVQRIPLLESMTRMAKQGVSANRALQSLRALGKVYRTQDFFQDYKALRAYHIQSDTLPDIPMTRRISRAEHLDTHMQYAERYAYRVEVLANDINTGSPVKSRWITIESPTTMSKRRILEATEDAWGDRMEKYLEGDNAVRSGWGQIVALKTL